MPTPTELPRLRYLAQDAPWPSHSGAALRDAGLLRELARSYAIDLVVLTRSPLTEAQQQALAAVATQVTVVRARDADSIGRLRLIPTMFLRRMPYHNALVLTSSRGLRWPRSVVFTGSGAWGSLAPAAAAHWILNQTDADIDFWRVYAAQSRGLVRRSAARLNYWLAAQHFPAIYRRVGRIISVCEEDRRLTQQYAPQVPIDVIANGVDCSRMQPQRVLRRDEAPQLLFSGTSAARNLHALEHFLQRSWPLIRAVIPTARLCVAGDWQPAAQAQFRGTPGVWFTGRQDDLRPYFNQADLYIAPFSDSHGSKLKLAEALAMALPVVATAAAARGLAVRSGEQLVLAADDADFAAQCLALLADAAQRATLAHNARRFAEQQLDWPVLGRRLATIVEDVRTSLGWD